MGLANLCLRLHRPIVRGGNPVCNLDLADAICHTTCLNHQLRCNSNTPGPGLRCPPNSSFDGSYTGRRFGPRHRALPKPGVNTIFTELIAEQTVPSNPGCRVVKRGTLFAIFNRAGRNVRPPSTMLSQSDDGQSVERIFPAQTIAFQGQTRAEAKTYHCPPRQIAAGNNHFHDRDDHPNLHAFQNTMLNPEVREAWTTGIMLHLVSRRP